MRIANAGQGGTAGIVISNNSGAWRDLSRGLQLMDPAARPAATIQDLLDTGRFDLDLFHRVLDAGTLELDERELQFQAPFARPGQIIALARNYTAHAQESTLPLPREPIFFSKSNTSVVGPGERVVLPPNLGRIEPEIELAVIMRKRASHVPAADAMNYVAGYTILNDVSAQELQAREIRESYPLFRCKSLPTFTPMGPCILTVDEAGVNPALKMELRVNGEARVVTNTSGLTFGIPRLVEFISGYIDLFPGDVITTGCPKAAGGIQPGDEMELEIQGIGVLRNPVVAGTELCPA